MYNHTNSVTLHHINYDNIHDNPRILVLSKWGHATTLKMLIHKICHNNAFALQLMFGESDIDDKLFGEIIPPVLIHPTFDKDVFNTFCIRQKMYMKKYGLETNGGKSLVIFSRARILSTKSGCSPRSVR